MRRILDLWWRLAPLSRRIISAYLVLLLSVPLIASLDGVGPTAIVEWVIILVLLGYVMHPQLGRWLSRNDSNEE